MFELVQESLVRIPKGAHVAAGLFIQLNHLFLQLPVTGQRMSLPGHK